MEQQKDFRETRFSSEAIKEVFLFVTDLIEKNSDEPDINIRLKVQQAESTWYYDDFDEFIGDFERYDDTASLLLEDRRGIRLDAMFFDRWARVSVESRKRAEIVSVMNIFDKHAKLNKLPPKQIEETSTIKPTVFIGHGRNIAWKDLKEHLVDKHHINVEAYETGARAGHSIRDILEDMVAASSFALLVFTGEDKQVDGAIRARQNVIHEAGLFQGSLGFARAIILLEDGVEEFSNVQGIQYIPFAKNNIKEAFGDVLATIQREFYK